MASIASEVRGVVVDSGLLARRIYRHTAPDGASLPYGEISEPNPPETLMRGDADDVRWEQRDIVIRVSQTRGGTVDPRLPRSVSDLFRRRTVTVGGGRVHLRAGAILEVDREDLGLLQHEIVVRAVAASGTA